MFLVLCGDHLTIYTIIKKGFDLIEKRKINSIVYKMVYAVESKKVSNKYRTPLLSRLLTKIYLIFLK